MSNEPKTPRPRIEDLPALQIVEVEDTQAGRLEELADTVNRIGHFEPEAPNPFRWN